MSNGRSSGLGETCKSVIAAQAVKDATGYQDPINSKYTHKGISLEDDAIALLGKLTYQTIQKNELHFSDDHFTGTPDIITADAIRDTKCAFSKGTFPTQYELEKKVAGSGYDYQGHVYMHLVGRKFHFIDYLLLPTPIERCYTEEEEEMFHHWVVRLHKFDLKHAHRFKRIEFDPKLIESGIKKIESNEVQEFYQEVYEGEPKLIGLDEVVA